MQYKLWIMSEKNSYVCLPCVKEGGSRKADGRIVFIGNLYNFTIPQSPIGDSGRKGTVSRTSRIPCCRGRQPLQ